jgi:hypothetical protein
MIALTIAAMLVAVLALAGWAWTLVFMNRAFLPYAQGLAALETLNAKMDERIRMAFANMGKRNEPKPPAEQSRPGGDQNPMAEIQRRAREMGFQVDSQGNVAKMPSAMPPMPEPVTLDIVEA